MNQRLSIKLNLMYARIDAALGASGRAFPDALHMAGGNQRRLGIWNDIKQDAAMPTHAIHR